MTVTMYIYHGYIYGCDIQIERHVYKEQWRQHFSSSQNGAIWGEPALLAVTVDVWWWSANGVLSYNDIS